MIINRLSFLLFILFSVSLPCSAQSLSIWEIGKADRSSSDLAMGPASYADFLHKDFGWEDRYFLIGVSDAKKDWPYIMPGPQDGWGGTGGTSGIRSQVLNILFQLQKPVALSKSTLTINLLGYNGKQPPLLKIVINGQARVRTLPSATQDNTIKGDTTHANYYTINVALDNLLKDGGNEIQISSLDGSWIVFDQVKMESVKPLKLITPEKIFVRNVKAANYEIAVNDRRYQPLLVDIEHLSGRPKLTVEMEGKELFTAFADSSRYEYEVPMPAVKVAKNSLYKVRCDGQLIASGKINRSPQRPQGYSDYVDTRLGTAHSRWMIAPGPWMPFGMVKISPDNQNSGWMGGYDPTFESIGTFSHIHEWTMAGLGIMPTAGPLRTSIGDQRRPGEGYRSAIDKSTEVANLGAYSVHLKDHNIHAELTATTRASMQRYTYSGNADSRIMIDLMIPAEYGYTLKDITIKKVSDQRIEGYSLQYSKDVWSGGINQEYKVNFVIEFDRPIKKYGTWHNNNVGNADLVEIKDATNAGAYVEFDTRVNKTVQVRTGISLVSLHNASENLLKEITEPFGWNFHAVVENQKNTWNRWLGRLEISSNDRREKIRFYTNMYRALASRTIWSDIDGSWIDASKRTQKMKHANDLALGCDAFWNTFWNLNQFWNLATPEWSSRWVRSQLAMYDANGWLAKGPAGMNYVPVMVAEHEIPLIVGAYQMGIRDFDAEKAFEAIKKMQTTPAQQVGKAGFAGNEDLNAYLKYKYVPYDKGRFSNTLEYAFDDWTAAQFARSLGKEKDYRLFKDRSAYWKNVIDTVTGYARMKNSDGTWFSNFDPFKSGANEHYVEGNAWQLTYFVPQDIPGLIAKIGHKRFVDRLTWGFTESNKLRFNAPGDQYWDYPVIQGNQQSMHFAFLFNWAGKPWLTQTWSRAIMNRYYGYGVANAYLGDEDQGQMSSWFIMNAIGLFQINGGTGTHPVYEIGSPIFNKVKINLNGLYGRGNSFTIVAKNTSRKNKYVQSALLNGKELNTFWFPVSELLKGGELVLEMGAKPNINWGTATLPLQD